MIPSDASVAVLVIIFRAYLADHSMDHLSAALKRGNIKDLLLFFPPNRRDPKVLDEFFRKEGLPQVADWYTKKQYSLAKEGIVGELKNLSGRGESTETVSVVRLDLMRHLIELRGSDHCSDTEHTRGAITPRRGANPVYVAGSHGLRRLECPARPDRGPCPTGNRGACPAPHLESPVSDHHVV